MTCAHCGASQDLTQCDTCERTLCTREVVIAAGSVTCWACVTTKPIVQSSEDELEPDSPTFTAGASDVVHVRWCENFAGVGTEPGVFYYRTTRARRGFSLDLCCPLRDGVWLRSVRRPELDDRLEPRAPRTSVGYGRGAVL